MERGQEVGAVFFNFKKAFDSVPHWALLQKLESLGINQQSRAQMAIQLFN